MERHGRRNVSLAYSTLGSNEQISILSQDIKHTFVPYFVFHSPYGTSGPYGTYGMSGFELLLVCPFLKVISHYSQRSLCLQTCPIALNHQSIIATDQAKVKFHHSMWGTSLRIPPGLMALCLMILFLKECHTISCLMERMLTVESLDILIRKFFTIPCLSARLTPMVREHISSCELIETNICR